ncbi:MAG TPA: hypothetical protein VIR65_15720 [Rhizorhapis sp.]
MTKTLAQFAISRSGDDYILLIEDDSGDTLELAATFDQLDLISEAIDEQLDRDEEGALLADDDISADLDADLDDEDE